MALCLIACSSPPATHRAIVGSSALKDEPGGNRPPAAVFRTTPPADPDGTIRGALPLGVTFNTCATTDPDEGDSLKTTYDFDGDGVVDLSGHCRAGRHFDAPAHVRVCVTDRQPGHETCASYRVGAPQAVCPLDDRPVVAEVEPNGFPNAPMGPFAQSVLISGTLTGDPDDYFSFTNTCNVPTVIQVRTFGPGGPGDCSMDPMIGIGLQLESHLDTIVWGTVGSACSIPAATFGVPPGFPVKLRVGSNGTPGYMLQILMAQGTSWNPDRPLE